MENQKEMMEKAIQNARKGMEQQEGGPFGAIIIDEQGTIIAQANNQVLKQKDPTAHAEIVAIRKACKKLGTYDLKGCSIYSSCQPCPMCLSAIIWANIRKIYYAGTRKDAAKIGFRDDKIYQYLEGKQKDLLTVIPVEKESCVKLFEEYQKRQGTIY